MKRVRKFIIRFFALAILAMLIAGGVLGGFGYKMYHDALLNCLLLRRSQRFKLIPIILPWLKSRRFIWTQLWQWKITVLNSILGLT